MVLAFNQDCFIVALVMYPILPIFGGQKNGQKNGLTKTLYLAKQTAHISKVLLGNVLYTYEHNCTVSHRLGCQTPNCTSGAILLLKACQAGCAPCSKVRKRSTWHWRDRGTQQRHMQKEHTTGLGLHHSPSLVPILQISTFSESEYSCFNPRDHTANGICWA